jgi:hypothetical protein
MEVDQRGFVLLLLVVVIHVGGIFVWLDELRDPAAVFLGRRFHIFRGRKRL